MQDQYSLHPDIRPHLPDYIRIAYTNDSKIVFFSTEHRILFNGKNKIKFFKSIINQLDGTKTVREMVSHLQPDEQKQVCLFISRLWQQGLLKDQALYQTNDLTGAEIKRQQQQIRLFSQFMDNPYQGQANLKKAAITVIGLGQLGRLIAFNLADAGIGRINIIEVNPGKISANREAQDQLENRLKTDHAGLHILLHQLDGHLIEKGQPEEVEKLRQIMAGSQSNRQEERAVKSDLVVLCQFPPSHGLVLNINQLCLEQEIAFFNINLDWSLFEMGPLFIPRKTACYECYHLRALSNQDLGPQSQLIDSALENRPLDNPLTLSLFSQTAAGQAGLEIIKQISGFARPLTYNRFYSCNLITQESRLDPVLKVPRCPVCSRLSEHALENIWPAL